MGEETIPQCRMRSCLLSPLVWTEVEHQIIRTLGHRMDWVCGPGIPPRSLTPASGTSFYSRVSNNTKHNSEMKTHTSSHFLAVVQPGQRKSDICATRCHRSTYPHSGESVSGHGEYCLFIVEE